MNGKSNDVASSVPQSPTCVNAVKIDGTSCGFDEKQKFIDSHQDVAKCDLENNRVRKESTGSRCSGNDVSQGRNHYVTGSRRSLTPPINDRDDDVAAVARDDGLSPAVAAVTLPSGEDHGAAKAIVFFIALSLDCILGGLSLGLQRSPNAVWTVLVGILAHEAVVGFGLGLQLAGRACDNRRHWTAAMTMAAVYACVGPVGVIIGTGVSEYTGSPAATGESVNMMLVNGLLQGFATGVFIYVTFFELLDGKVNGASRYCDLFAILAGYAVMAAIAAVPKGGELDHGNNATTSVPFDVTTLLTRQVTLA